jgi:hypothetical protein
MTWISECPECGAYISEHDGQEEVLVEQVLCDKCGEAYRLFDAGWEADQMKVEREYAERHGNGLWL